MAELVDAHGSGPCIARCGDSSSLPGTINLSFEFNQLGIYKKVTAHSDLFFCFFQTEFILLCIRFGVVGQRKQVRLQFSNAAIGITTDLNRPVLCKVGFLKKIDLPGNQTRFQWYFANALLDCAFQSLRAAIEFIASTISAVSWSMGQQFKRHQINTKLRNQLKTLERENKDMSDIYVAVRLACAFSALKEPDRQRPSALRCHHDGILTQHLDSRKPIVRIYFSKHSDMYKASSLR